jgi:hypothetical protein
VLLGLQMLTLFSLERNEAMKLCLNRKMVVAFSVALAVLMVAHEAMAQRGGGRGFGRRGGFQTSRVQLATLPEVQTALNLTDEQKELVASLDEERSEARRGGRRGGGGGGGFDFRAFMEEREKQDAELAAKLSEKLEESQNDRLTEIYVQVNGTNSLADKQVQAKLEITEEQVGKLADAREENNEAMRDAFQDFADMSQEERQQTTDELREESNERLLAVLTDEQKSSFEALKGEELEIDMSQLRGGRGGGRGGFGGGGGGRGNRGGGGRGGDGGGDRPARPE